MRFLFLALLLLGGPLLLAACDSNGDSPGDPPTGEDPPDVPLTVQETIDLITLAPWTLVDAPASLVLAEQYDFRDDATVLLTFADGVVRETEWALDEIGTVLVVRQQGGERRYTIETLTETTLVLGTSAGPITFARS